MAWILENLLSVKNKYKILRKDYLVDCEFYKILHIEKMILMHY